MEHTANPELGAIYLGNNRCSFRVWAPLAQTVALHIVAPEDRVIPLHAEPHGYYHATVENVAPGTRYLYRLDDEKERPDPASRFQPDGVHQPSQVVDPQFAWTDTTWVGLPLHDYIIYELHIGTFTTEGTFDAAIAQLDMLKDLGITAVEVMPVAEFPGSRNWGYDGTYHFSVQSSYGGPEGLKRFVNACHERGLSVVLDVVYNHFGPEGNYLWDYAGAHAGTYFFTNAYQTPWGAAINFDGPHNEAVRRFFTENALMWVSEYHIDALRLDAVHAIRDFSAQPFMEELADALHRQAARLGRRIYSIAESDQNDPRLLNPPQLGGYGLDAQWNDDFHHAVHTLLTGENDGYYADFGNFAHLVKIFEEGWSYGGTYSEFRQRRHGRSSRGLACGRLVVCIQNHDQVGNRMLGERLSSLVSFDALKLGAATLLLSPFVPMLFMGEEYGEPAPFLYFVNHTDPNLVEAVRQGRKEEFSSFAWKGEPPDPQDEATHNRSRPDYSLREQGKHRVLFDLYRELIRLRKTLPALTTLAKEKMDVRGFEAERVLMVRRWSGSSSEQNSRPGGNLITLLNYNTHAVDIPLPFPPGLWHLLFNSASERWQGESAGATEAPPSLPQQLASNGTVQLTLAPYASIVYSHMEER
jgi:maltooligosyltrehalose trehalohydrolase